MTLEEAIRQLNSLLEFSGTYVGRLCISAENREAVKLVLNTLRPITREQVEKMQREWMPIHGLAEYYCSCCGVEFEIHSYDKQRYRFCPYCGAPMTDKAVDILWKRLEAMQDEAETV